MALIIDMEMPKACVWEKAPNTVDVCKMIHRCPYAKASAEKRPEGCLIKGEIPDKHGNIIDANELVEHYEALADDNGMYTEDAEETVETIRNIPKVILKGNVEATE